jgi:hypothetical protein
MDTLRGCGEGGDDVHYTNISGAQLATLIPLHGPCTRPGRRAPGGERTLLWGPESTGKRLVGNVEGMEETVNMKAVLA